MMIMHENDNPALKEEVRAYWNAHPCGTQFTGLVPGSEEFYAEVEKFRYWSQPYMHDVFQYDAFKGRSVLEIGCGLGTDLLQFARAGARVTGVDLSDVSVGLVQERFRQEGLSIEARPADAESLPFGDDTFDAVYSFGVLHHTPNTPKAVGEAIRVLRPGGTLMLMLYHSQSIHSWVGRALNNLTSTYRVKDGSMSEWIRIFDGSDNPLGKAYSRSEVRNMIAGIDHPRFTVVDPVRRNWPSWLNAVNQKVLARFFGFYLVTIGTKKP